MSRLILEPNLAEVDDIYQSLVDAHAGRSDGGSMRLNARLILLLANHIGDQQVIREAIACAAAIGEEDTPTGT
jgi:3-(3-hydroxy-phenyl)propionate hydroxylase